MDAFTRTQIEVVESPQTWGNIESPKLFKNLKKQKPKHCHVRKFCQKKGGCLLFKQYMLSSQKLCQQPFLIKKTLHLEGEQTKAVTKSHLTICLQTVATRTERKVSNQSLSCPIRHVGMTPERMSAFEPVCKELSRTVGIFFLS